MINLWILDYNGCLVTEVEMDNNMPIPNKGDTVLINENNDSYRASVLRREFDFGLAKKGIFKVVTDYVKHNKKEIDETLLP